MSTNPTSRPVGTIMMPTARLAQLRTLAGLREPPITVNELIEQLINREIEAGVLPDELPGFTVGIVPHGSGFAVEFTMALGFGFEKMRPSDALAIAGLLDDVSIAGTARGKSVGSAPHQIKIARIGRGVVIAGLEPDQRRSLTPQMARDLARQLRRAAAFASEASKAC